MVQVSRDVSDARAAARQRAPGTEFVALSLDAQLQVLAEVRAALLRMTGRGAVRPEHPKLTIRHNHDHSDYSGHRHSHPHEHNNNADHHHDHSDIDMAVASTERARESRQPVAAPLC
jgi:ABC-type Zn2+ transport system substrate-binding protein/surface adhesin